MYRKQTRPYSAPWALNVRTAGPSESRRRGGARPGLEKFCPTNLGGSVTSLMPVTYIDSSGIRQHDLVYVANGTLGYVRAGVSYAPAAELEGPLGVDILDDNGLTIDFSTTVSVGSMQGAVRAGKVYFADSVLKSYEPGSGVVESAPGSPPAGQPIICVYRDRIFLAGLTQAWYASRMGYPEDWGFGAAMEDPGAAVAGQLADAGSMGHVLTAMIPLHDKILVMATENSLWLMHGDPTTGRLVNVSDDTGVVSSGAWAVSPDGLLAFLSNDGVYVWDAGSGARPTRFSAERVPDELRDIDTATNTISMAYDSFERGFHLFITPDVGVGTHWWIDVENKAFWPQLLSKSHQPHSAALLVEDGLGDVVLGSQDGYLRYFADGRPDDDGEAIESHVLLGPVRISADDVRDALLAEIHGVMDDISNSGTVTWRVVMGKSAAEAAESAILDLDAVVGGGSPSSVSASGSWSEGRGRVQRPRSRGPWLVIWLSSTDSWSYEVVAVVARQLGRHR